MTPDSTPDNRGGQVAFLLWSLDFNMHLTFTLCAYSVIVNNVLTNLIDVSILLAWKRWVKFDNFIAIA